MYNYNVFQWLLFFFIYCFLGWIIESSIVSFNQKRLVNRGFLKGPLLPLYGSGAITVLFVTLPFKDNIFLVYFVGMISATILEYFTGWLMETLFKMKYWDYTNDKFNYKGRICLECSIFWGFLSIFLTFVIHPPIENLVLNGSIDTIKILILSISVIVIADFIYSVYNLIHLNKILSFISKIKEEKDKISIQLKELKSTASSAYDLTSLKSRFSDLTSKYDKLTAKLKFSHIQIIKAYPSAYSKKFNDALKDLRTKISEKIDSITK